MRLAVLLAVIFHVIRVVAVLVCLAVYPIGFLSESDGRRIVEAGPAQSAVVVETKEDRSPRFSSVTVYAAVPPDGRRNEVRGAETLEPLPRVGQRIDVVVDPNDPTYVLAVGVDRTPSWFDHLMSIGLSLLLAGMAFMGLAKLTEASTYLPSDARHRRK